MTALLVEIKFESAFERRVCRLRVRTRSLNVVRSDLIGRSLHGRVGVRTYKDVPNRAEHL